MLAPPAVRAVRGALSRQPTHTVHRGFLAPPFVPVAAAWGPCRGAGVRENAWPSLPLDAQHLAAPSSPVPAERLLRDEAGAGEAGSVTNVWP